MPLRQSTGKPIPLSPTPATSATQRILAVRLFTQMLSRWCWCACCEMTLDFFAARRSPQCDIANYGLGIKTCCGGPPLPPACNGMIWTIHPVLTDITDVYNYFGRATTHSGSPATFKALCKEIDPPTSKPLQVCFAWAGGGGHVALVCGYRVSPPTGRYAYVNDPDPARGSGWVRLPSLTTAYGAGSWTETFTF